MKKVWEEHYLKTGRTVGAKHELRPHLPIQFFHFVSENLGERYFKVDWVNNDCISVVIKSGEKKKGRPHMEGIYKLAVSTFRGTYHWYYGRKGLSGRTNLLLTTENQYNQAFDRAAKQLK